jgi:hypothetical protein
LGWNARLRRRIPSFAEPACQSDNFAVNLPESPDPPRSARVPKSAVIAMAVIVGALALVSIYANIQRLRRDKLETVILTPVATPTATP